MVFSRSRFDQHVIDICFHGSTQQRFKSTGHHALVGGSDILETKRHYVITIHPRWSYECCVCRIEGKHRDLIVARVCVDEGQELMACYSIYYLIDAWEGKGIFRASIIQIRIIYAHMPFSILLGDNHHVG